jgi:hypothetical protein
MSFIRVCCCLCVFEVFVNQSIDPKGKYWQDAPVIIFARLLNIYSLIYRWCIDGLFCVVFFFVVVVYFHSHSVFAIRFDSIHLLSFHHNFLFIFLSPLFFISNMISSSILLKENSLLLCSVFCCCCWKFNHLSCMKHTETKLSRNNKTKKKTTWDC